MRPHTDARPAATMRHAATSRTNPATSTATCIIYPGRKRTFTATSAVNAVTTAR